MSYIIPKPTEFDFAKSAYNELMVANRVPVTQITATYGILPDTFSTALGGTATAANSKFVCQTGTSSTGIAVISTDLQVSYRSGQGLGCMLTGVFDTPKANNTQIAGFVTSDALMGFGYNGLDYGIGIARNGTLCIRELTVTVAATGAENATVTVDGLVLTIPLTAGTTTHNAWQISNYIRLNAPLYNSTSNANVVTVIAKLPEFGGGTFAFSSATAVAAWVQKQAGAVPTETWISKALWNVNPDIVIDPSKGNIYMIQYQYLGFGDTFYSIQNAVTSKIEVVHIDKYINTSTIVNIPTPVFRAGWATRNTGNTTNVTLQGGSAEIFIEGEVVYDSPVKGSSNSVTATTASYTNVLAFRNRLAFNSKTNRINILPINMSVATESTKICRVLIYEDPIFTTNPGWAYVDVNGSIMEVAKNNVLLTSGKLISSKLCVKETPLNLPAEEFAKIIKPGKAYAVMVQLSSAAASIVDASITWREDF